MENQLRKDLERILDEENERFIQKVLTNVIQELTYFHHVDEEKLGKLREELWHIKAELTNLI